ncbi:hypothetical protein IA57_05470 [Mangrovimonas yunxiaonensis]|uniref:Uncharacterized protein n=1 Tax=Mangrovimonas yunxiaonensis TaxID=1197477 RepID=A0A084TKP5_9FLAO|nr:hypothetical protein IA57_05470 [Mangrovimonas yunxiaonensis]GGH37620.1 hypothetical protein GCM10011364_05760 [Mangrovimonas yunxiaonensis]
MLITLTPTLNKLLITVYFFMKEKFLKLIKFYKAEYRRIKQMITSLFLEDFSASKLGLANIIF